MQSRVLSILLAGLMLAVASSVGAAEPANTYDPRAAFAETDKNGDGRIDHEEFYERLVDVFFSSDTDKDGYLSPEEYRQLPFSREFKNADTNGDGRVSLPEFVRTRFRQFEAADTDHDGVLSLDEVLVTYEEGTKR